MAITRLNVDGKPLAYKEEVTVHTENANIHVTSDEHSGLQDLLNPYAPINRSGMINVGENFGNKKIARFCLAENADVKPGGRYPYPMYGIFTGDPTSDITPTQLGNITHMSSRQTVEDFISDFNSKFPNIKATYISDLKNAGQKSYNNGTRALIELELINDWIDRNDIFIADLAMGANTFDAIQTTDGIWRIELQVIAPYMYFKDHTSLDITLNGESVYGHITNTDIHTTTEEKTEWNNKQDALQYYTESANSVVIGDTDTNATVTLKCGNTEVVLDEAALIKLNQLLNATFAYPENS